MIQNMKLIKKKWKENLSKENQLKENQLKEKNKL